MRLQFKTAVLVLACATATSCGINTSIHIADGETVEGGRATVNGSVRIGSGCEVRGTCRTVNGRITVGKSTTVGRLATVNGSISIADEVTVAGDVGTVNGSLVLGAETDIKGGLETVNGSVECGSGAVAKDIRTVNGGISLSGTRVGGSLTTTNGSVVLTDEARIAGDVVIRGKDRRGAKKKDIEIRISGNSVVEGGIIVRDPGRRVTVILSDGGRVEGEVRNAEIVDRSSS